MTDVVVWKPVGFNGDSMTKTDVDCDGDLNEVCGIIRYDCHLVLRVTNAVDMRMFAHTQMRMFAHTQIITYT